MRAAGKFDVPRRRDRVARDRLGVVRVEDLVCDEVRGRVVVARVVGERVRQIALRAVHVRVETRGLAEEGVTSSRHHAAYAIARCARLREA